jgi:transposase
LRFIARLLEGESMSDLCREAGISRKTGYKILGRYKEEGVTAIRIAHVDLGAMPISCRSPWRP